MWFVSDTHTFLSEDWDDTKRGSVAADVTGMALEAEWKTHLDQQPASSGCNKAIYSYFQQFLNSCVKNFWDKV